MSCTKSIHGRFFKERRVSSTFKFFSVSQISLLCFHDESLVKGLIASSLSLAVVKVQIVS